MVTSSPVESLPNGSELTDALGAHPANNKTAESRVKKYFIGLSRILYQTANLVLIFDIVTKKSSATDACMTGNQTS